MDMEQIKINKQFVINLQNQGILPIFLLDSDTFYLNSIEYWRIVREEWPKCYYAIKEDPVNEKTYLDNYHKAVNEEYALYLGSVKRPECYTNVKWHIT